MDRTALARVIGVVVLVAACCTVSAGSPAATATATAARRHTATVTIPSGGYLHGFSPTQLTVRRGTRLRVVNHDAMRHTFTSRKKDAAGHPLFDVAIAPHHTVVVKAVSRLAAGTYPFYCSVHPNMRGTLRVTGGPGGTTGAATTYPLPLVLPRQVTGPSVDVPIERADVRMLPTGPTTPMWTYGGSYPGLTIREPAGQATDVTFDDRLPASSGPLSVHLHGDHHPSVDDGLPTTTTGGQTNPLLEPGRSLTYHYPLTDSAAPGRNAFDFYHDHVMGVTGRNNWNGLQAMFIVDSPTEQSLGLPSGGYDVPLMVSDRSFTADNRLEPYAVAGAPPDDTTVGTDILVDGRYHPHLDVATHRYRLRLLNASAYQSYDFALSDGRPLRQIGTGDGLLPHAVDRQDIILGPAQRADVIVDFAGELHKDVVLRSIPSTDHAPGAVGSPAAPLMQFRVTRSVTDTSRAPDDLQPAPPIDVPSSVSQEWDVDMGSSGGHSYWTVNGQPYDPSVVMDEVPLGSTQLWTLRNDSDVTHYLHLHEEAWHTVARIGADGVAHAPPPWERGLEDTWRLDPGTAVEVAATFSDDTGVFMLHCHMLGHEDDGMMAQWAVVDPDASPGSALPAGYVYRPLSGWHPPLPGTPIPPSGSSMATMPGMPGIPGR